MLESWWQVALAFAQLVTERIHANPIHVPACVLRMKPNQAVTMRIRDALISDCPAMAELRAASWRVAYMDAISAENLAC